jgi:hypothetical protein
MTTSEMIKVMQAYDSGRQIECRRHGDDAWGEVTEPYWNWELMAYRVAPRTIWVAETGNGSRTIYHTKPAAPFIPDATITQYVEVVGD